MGSALSRLSEEISYYKNMRPSWICEIVILAFLEITPASENTNREGKSTSQMTSSFFFLVLFQPHMLF